MRSLVALESADASTPSINSLNQGLAYLNWVAQRLPDSNWLELGPNATHQTALIKRLGQDVHGLNRYLDRLAFACRECFVDSRVPSLQIVAAPLKQELGLEGYCCLTQRPILLIIDAGRAHPDDWLGVVAHEVTHAVSGPGHGHAFHTVVAHLCLGLGLAFPPREEEGLLQRWPPRRQPAIPNFWLEHGWPA